MTGLFFSAQKFCRVMEKGFRLKSSRAKLRQTEALLLSLCLCVLVVACTNSVYFVEVANQSSETIFVSGAIVESGRSTLLNPQSTWKIGVFPVQESDELKVDISGLTRDGFYSVNLTEIGDGFVLLCDSSLALRKLEIRD